IETSQSPQGRADIMADESLLPRMSQKEILCFQKHLAGATDYVEFGSGGSTVLGANAQNIRRMWSVEGNPQWYSRLLERDDVAGAIRMGRLTFEYIDIGPVGRNSKPTDETSSARSPAYHE